MSQFIQLHLLTSYPPANLNRDDLGRPKTAIMGGAKRLRVSSQSLKRNWRVSDLFQDALSQNLGIRTKRIGPGAEKYLVEHGITKKDAREWAVQIAKVFGDVAKDQVETSQLVHVAPEEKAAVDSLVETLASEQREPTEEELELLRVLPAAVDIALFGRMLAAAPRYNVEAACQVAHAITVHAAEIEDDYFTAVDDLNPGDEDRGAGHIGETGFGAGLFYSYICINRDQLVDNLQGDSELADRAIAALTEAAVMVSPKGKQNSFGSRAHASYVLVERGAQQPRSLSVAFLRPIAGQNQAEDAIQSLEKQVTAFDGAYGTGADRRYVVCVQPDYDSPGFNGNAKQGNLAGLFDFLNGE